MARVGVGVLGLGVMRRRRRMTQA
ncbi:hypothetical protein HHL15_24015 [Zoogloea sp. G-4-1-14]|uniref:Uncharacterized protein n=1 Tax=Zoogloea dura TaxID=2728840 RepID=A0A848GEI4_9RHOO|nr:hypothetical protein [Zoogloea dura]